MTTIFLIRHGEVAGNSGEVRTFAGMRDLELTPRGLLQAQAVANRMAKEKLDAVYASTLQRAYLTADDIAAKHNLTTIRDAGWCEVNYGEWEGLSEEDILKGYADLWRQRVADPWNIAPPQGESYDERRAHKKVCLYALVDAGFEVAVPAEHARGDQVVLRDDLFYSRIERAAVAYAGGASVPDQVEAQPVEIRL